MCWTYTILSAWNPFVNTNSAIRQPDSNRSEIAGGTFTRAGEDHEDGRSSADGFRASEESPDASGLSCLLQYSIRQSATRSIRFWRHLSISRAASRKRQTQGSSLTFYSAIAGRAAACRFRPRRQVQPGAEAEASARRLSPAPGFRRARPSLPKQRPVLL